MHSQPLPINVVGRQDLVPVADFGETMGNFIHLLSSGLMAHVAFSQVTRVEPSIVLGDVLVALYNLEAIASLGELCA